MTQCAWTYNYYFSKNSIYDSFADKIRFSLQEITKSDCMFCWRQMSREKIDENKISKIKWYLDHIWACKLIL